MHAHHKKFTQRFLANQPWKNPHGENQSERRVLINFFSNVQDRKIVKILLISTTYFISKSGNLCPAKQPYTLLDFCAYNKCNCTAANRPYISSKTVPINAVRTAADWPYPYSKSVQILAARTAVNSAVLFLEICANI